MERIGASELLSSWPITRIRRCQAWRSSSRSARLTSASTRAACGRPRWRKLVRRMSKRPAAPANAASAVRVASPVRNGARPSASAPRPTSRSAGRPEQALARAVEQLQLGAGVEREHRDVDLLHHLAQERRGLERAQPLLAQHLGERVDLDERLAQRVVAAPDARAEREVLLAQRPQQVRQRLQRPRHRPRARRPRRRATTRRPASRASSACAAAGRCARADRP